MHDPYPELTLYIRLGNSLIHYENNQQKDIDWKLDGVN